MATIDKISTHGLFNRRPALKALTAYAAGIALARLIPVYSLAIISIAVAFTIAGLILGYKTKTQAATIGLFAALLFAGIAQYKVNTSDFPPTHIKHIAEAEGTVTVIGEIAAEPDVRSDKTYLTVDVDTLNWRDRTFQSCGKLMVKINQPTNSYSFGDRLKFDGYLFTPVGPRHPGGFDYAAWLENRGIYGMIVLRDTSAIKIQAQSESVDWGWLGFADINKRFINNIIAPVRSFLLEGYDKYLSPEHASLLAGFVLGEKRDLPAETVQLFRDTGTFHLMAVSGSNVAVVVGFFLTITLWANRKLRILITLAAVIFFCFLTRNEPSVVRASVMAAVGLLGFYRRKNPDMLGLLGFAGLVLLIINPLWLFHAGFQLSFAACGGIVYFSPLITSIVKPSRSLWLKIPYWALFILTATIAAQLATLPITAEYFNRLPLLGMLANLPMVTFAYILTIAGICFLPVLAIGGHIAGWYAWVVAKIIMLITPLLRYFAEMPSSVVNINSLGWLKIGLFYAALYFFSELLFRKRTSFKAFAVCLMLIAGLLGVSYLKGQESESLTFIDCETDRAVLFDDAVGHKYLWYNCYENGDCSQIEQNLLPFLLKNGINKIDTVFSETSKIFPILTDKLIIIKVIEPSKINIANNINIGGTAPYFLTESILNKTVKFVKMGTDNNIETLTNGYFYKLTMSGGELILAGTLEPRLAEAIDSECQLLELPWSAQPNGVTCEQIKSCPPDILVFSPDKKTSATVRSRDKLTYFSERTWATAFAGSFRIRLASGHVYVDYMLEP